MRNGNAIKERLKQKQEQKKPGGNGKKEDLINQTANRVHHNEECPGDLRKEGMANVFKAGELYSSNNWQQAAHFSDLAATKF